MFPYCLPQYLSIASGFVLGSFLSAPIQGPHDQTILGSIDTSTTMASSLCSPSSFTSLSLVGAEILNVAATPVSEIRTVIYATIRKPAIQIQLDYCNVTVSYTHNGYDDLINVETWLPAPDAWNERIWATGGGGFRAGRDVQGNYNTTMSIALNDGYATTSTDSGTERGAAPSLGDWGLLTPGNLDVVRFSNFAGRSLEEQALLGRQVVGAYYGRAHKFSYFGGCSQGGRQALALAQKYPDLYDGILASAPALSINAIVPQIHWPYQYMIESGNVSRDCEVQAITEAAVEACDGFDGVEDGIVAEYERCAAEFDPFSVVGKPVDCIDGARTVTEASAAVVNATWDGVRSAQGRRLWAPVTPGTDLVGNGTRPISPGADIVSSDCSSGTCVAVPYPLGPGLLKNFLALDPGLDVSNVSKAEFDRLVKFGMLDLTQWQANYPDLTDFQRAGGKIITPHGTADSLIPIGGMVDYYKKVGAISPDVHDFYRFFEVPGLSHCYGGKAGVPVELMKQLRSWVEDGTTPENSTYEALTKDGHVEDRLLCPYPQKATFDKECGDSAKAACWTCVDGLS
ncbi:hypothetical protein PgNI_11052 [Pyricularia grisea]|uniref:Carboxylic ester hydrolase n=1 Tax=Pyricularia grisea TaxID=148305 RepID=A0A6P8AXK7_PYRGI|nr:hypothetical protein PgNI_11052 [Pyricularia grisea]TLD07073.1 hypothetical protein PgNI_11052 [Pyricularia grisea]